MAELDTSARNVAFRGMRDMLPIAAGGVPFGLIAGVAASEIALSPLEATAVSMTVFAGAAQLASYDLLSRGAPVVVVLLTAVIINLRFALYSAAIAPVFTRTPRWLRVLYAYLLTDQAYALTAARRAKSPGAPRAVAYYVGSATALWLMWVTTTFVGAYAGASIPASWSLDFAVPLCFVALLLPAIQDRAQVGCVVVTTVVSLAAMRAPHGSGVIVSVLVGIAAGAGFDRVTRRRPT